jgi:ABC-type phosphate transport system substrate-binding protein
MILGLAALAACGSATTSQSSSPATAKASASASAGSSLTPAGATDVYPLVAGYQGHFTGSWNDSTFNTTGAMTWDISANNQTRQVTIKLNVGGKFFGGPGAAPETILLTHLAQGTISGHSAAFGDISGTISPSGTLQMTLSKIALGAIDHVTVTGHFTGGNSITMQYTVYFAGGGQPATGTVTLKRS